MYCSTSAPLSESLSRGELLLFEHYLFYFNDFIILYDYKF